MYEVIDLPPVLGALKLKLTCVELDTEGVGAVIAFGTEVIVTADDADDAALFPIALVANTVKVCDVPLGEVSNPVKVAGEPLVSTAEPPGVPVIVYEVIGNLPSKLGAEYDTVAEPLSYGREVPTSVAVGADGADGAVLVDPKTLGTKKLGNDISY